VRWFLEAFEQVMTDIHQFPGPVWGVLRDLGKHAMTKREQVQA
jgi:ornithine--oxo-acid transaminase